MNLGIGVLGLLMSVPVFLSGRHAVRDSLLIIVFVFGLVRLVYSPSFFADYDSYLTLVEQLKNVEFFKLIGPEFIVRGVIKGLSTIIDDQARVVDIMSYVNTFMSILLLAYICATWARSNLNALIISALYGPLLFLVLIRASLAYLIVTYVILRGVRFRFISVCLLLIAVGFHASAIVAVGAIFLSGFVLKVRRKIAIRLGVAFSLTALLFVVLRADYLLKHAAEFIGTVVAEGSIIAERLIYFTQDYGERSYFHVFYAIFVAIAVIYYFAGRKYDKFSREDAYILTSFLVFVLMQIAPVAAFRFSLFFMIPLLLRLDFHGVVRNFCNVQLVNFVFYPIVYVLFEFSLLGVFVGLGDFSG